MAEIYRAGSGPAQARNPRTRVVTFGTSLTAAGRWQKTLQKKLELCWGRDVLVVNKASSGKGSTWGLANVAAVIEADPDIAIVEFAVNDARLKSDMTLDASRRQTRSIVEAIKSACPSAKVFLMITNPVHGHPAKGRPLLADYYQLYRDLATEGIAGLVDAYQAWSAASASDIPDGLHPTAAAHRAITVPAIVRVLAAECR